MSKDPSLLEQQQKEIHPLNGREQDRDQQEDGDGQEDGNQQEDGDGQEDGDEQEGGDEQEDGDEQEGGNEEEDGNEQRGGGEQESSSSSFQEGDEYDEERMKRKEKKILERALKQHTENLDRIQKEEEEKKKKEKEHLVFVEGKMEHDIPPNAVTPRHSFNVKFKTKRMEIIVRLQRIAPKLINFVVSETEFYLDTFKYTKKFYLRATYPQNAKVDPTKAEATFQHDSLKVVVPIIEIKDKVTGKKIRKKKESPSSIAPVGPKPTKTENKKADTPQSKKRERSNSAPSLPKPKKAKKTKPNPDNSRTLSMIEQINDIQDKKRKEILEREAGKISALDLKKERRQERRKEKLKLREKSIKEAKEAKRKRDVQV